MSEPREICPCETDVEGPGPTHIPSCPFSDPDYNPPGWPPDPREVRAVLLEAFHRAVARRERDKHGRKRS